MNNKAMHDKANKIGESFEKIKHDIKSGNIKDPQLLINQLKALSDVSREHMEMINEHLRKPFNNNTSMKNSSNN